MATSPQEHWTSRRHHRAVAGSVAVLLVVMGLGVTAAVVIAAVMAINTVGYLALV